MRRVILIWAAAAALWIAGVALMTAPHLALSDLARHGATAGERVAPAGPHDFYRGAADVRRDAMRRQAVAVARGYAERARRDLDLFLGLGLPPPMIALCLAILLRWAWEGRRV